MKITVEIEEFEIEVEIECEFSEPDKSVGYTGGWSVCSWKVVKQLADFDESQIDAYISLHEDQIFERCSEQAQSEWEYDQECKYDQKCKREIRL